MIYFLIFLFVEVYITSLFSDAFGGVILFIEILSSGIIGGFIIINFKYSLMESLRDLYNGKITQQELISSSIFSIVGASFMIIPGIFTDIIGILMQFEFLALMILRPFIKHKTTTTYSNKHDDVIDVEVIEK